MRSVPASIVRRVPLAWYLVAALALALAVAWRAEIREAERRGAAEAALSDARAEIRDRTADVVRLTASLDSLGRVRVADSTSAATAILHWRRIASRTDTVLVATPAPTLPEVVAAGDSLAAACERALGSCAQEAAASDSALVAHEARYAAAERAMEAMRRRMEASRARPWYHPGSLAIDAALIGAGYLLGRLAP